MALFIIFYFTFLIGGIVLFLITFRFLMIGLDCIKYLIQR